MAAVVTLVIHRQKAFTYDPDTGQVQERRFKWDAEKRRQYELIRSRWHRMKP